MGFIKFTDTGKSFSPKISISSRGQIGFSQGTRKRYNMQDFEYCVMYYDPDERKVAFELTNEQEAEGAVKLRHRNIGADIGAKSFLNYFNILPNGTFMYPAEAGQEPNWIIIDLRQGKERKTESDAENFDDLA